MKETCAVVGRNLRQLLCDSVSEHGRGHGILATGIPRLIELARALDCARPAVCFLAAFQNIVTPVGSVMPPPSLPYCRPDRLVPMAMLRKCLRYRPHPRPGRRCCCAVNCKCSAKCPESVLVERSAGIRLSLYIYHPSVTAQWLLAVLTAHTVCRAQNSFPYKLPGCN